MAGCPVNQEIKWEFLQGTQLSRKAGDLRTDLWHPYLYEYILRYALKSKVLRVSHFREFSEFYINPRSCYVKNEIQIK